MAWVTPKTNWALTNPDGSFQYFNVADYNRISGNIAHLVSLLQGGPVPPVQAMAAMDVTTIPTAQYFRAIEQNMAALLAIYTPPGYVAGKTFIGDGLDTTWTPEDLNRIESELQNIYYGLLYIVPRSGMSGFYLGLKFA